MSDTADSGKYFPQGTNIEFVKTMEKMNINKDFEGFEVNQTPVNIDEVSIFSTGEFPCNVEVPELPKTYQIKPIKDDDLDLKPTEGQPDIKILCENNTRIKSTPMLICAIEQNILENFLILSEVRQKQLFIYQKEEGFFKSYDRIAFDPFLRSLYNNSTIDHKLNSRVIAEIFQRLLTEPNQQVELDAFEQNTHLLNIKNGVVDIRSKEVYPHDPKYRFLRVIPVVYQSGYKPEAPKFRAAIEQACYRRDNRKFLLQAMGYLISNYYGKKIAFVFKGKGNSGKTMLLNLIALFVGGAEFVASIPLASFDKSFALAEFSRKKLNVVGELDTKALRTNAMVKSVIGGDIISAEFKHKDKFSFQCRTKNVFAINNFFDVEGSVKEEALFDRFQFIEFDGVVPSENRISHYEDVLFNEERDGIFYILVKALHKLFKNGFQFELSEQAKTLKKEFMGMKNPIEYFIHDKCEISSAGRISSRDLFDAYDRYRRENCFPPFSEVKFGREINRITGIDKSKARFNSKSLWGYIGLSLSDRQKNL